MLEMALVIDEKFPIIWLADIGLPAVKLYGKVIEVACADTDKKHSDSLLRAIVMRILCILVPRKKPIKSWVFWSTLVL